VPPSAGVRIARRTRLPRNEVAQVMRLVAEATEADGVRPLSEHVMLHLRYGGDEPVRNLLAYDGDDLVGYAHLDVTDPVEGSSAELVVRPLARQHGYGRALVNALIKDAPDARLRLWAHGHRPAADALASSMGFTRARGLLQLRRSLYAPLPDVKLPAGVSIRTFEIGRDEDAWREPWFDPAGFFLAERPDSVADERNNRRLVGFHWTKVHGDDPSTHGHEAIGEVYVVGVDPNEQGSGLGKALTAIGLRYLRSLGLGQVMLYVDASNERAIHVYEQLGFTHWDTDVSYRR